MMTRVSLLTTCTKRGNTQSGGREETRGPRESDRRGGGRRGREKGGLRLRRTFVSLNKHAEGKVAQPRYLSRTDSTYTCEIHEDSFKSNMNICIFNAVPTYNVLFSIEIVNIFRTIRE